jgi:signal peptidase II
MAKIISFRFHRLFLVALLMFSTIGCDQVSKIIVRDTLKFSPPISYLKNTIVLEHAENPGAFMSLGASLNQDLRFLIFTAIAALFLAVALLILLKQSQMNKWNTIGLSLLIGGGIGNLIDRALYGTVTDFINLGIGNHLRTGIFNLADVAVVLGFLILTFGHHSVDHHQNKSSGNA